MSETKWTAAPWDKKEMIGIAGMQEAGISLGFVNTSDDEYRRECKANARLISAAPELYQALCNLMIRYETLFDLYQRPTYATGSNPKSDLDLALTETVAALAKARGEQP